MPEIDGVLAVKALPCCAFIFFFSHSPCCGLFRFTITTYPSLLWPFFFALPIVLLSRFTITAYPTVPFIPLFAYDLSYPAVALFFFALTLLSSFFFALTRLCPYPLYNY